MSRWIFSRIMKPCKKKGKKKNAYWNGNRRCRKQCWRSRKSSAKNAILKGINLEEGATAVERNQQIGGHKA